MAETTLYDILELSPTADLDEIKAAYRRLSIQVHPDRGGSGALFRLVREAYATLSDHKLRAEYDRSGVNSGGFPRRARSTHGGSDLDSDVTPDGGSDHLDDDVKTLADRMSVLSQFLVQLEAEATSDQDHLEVYRVQLELQLAQIAWNLAVVRQLSAQGQWEAAAPFQTKASEGERSLPPIEKLIANMELQIAEKAGAVEASGVYSVRMIPCSLCGAKNRVSGNAESFSCGICKNKNLMLSCQTCGTQAYECKALSGNVATYVCETCHRESPERRNGERRHGERDTPERRKGVPG
jgi:DnaJ-class molecular chaperone